MKKKRRRDMFLRMPPTLPKKEEPVVDDTRTPDASGDMGKVAFIEGVKLAISGALKARAAAAARSRLSSLKNVLDEPLSRGARQVAEGNYERLARKIPAFEGIGKTMRGVKADITRHARAGMANANTVIKSPAQQATRIARGPAASQATKVVPPPKPPQARRRVGMAAPIFAAGAAGGVMGSMSGGRADAQA